MADTMEFECPCCGGSLAFDPNLQKLKCPYCDTEFDTEDLKAYQSELNKEHEDKQEWTSGRRRNGRTLKIWRFSAALPAGAKWWATKIPPL